MDALNRKQRSRLILFPMPFQGHINPMLQLANILHSKGFAISVIHTGYNSPDTTKYPHFAFHVIADDLSGETNDSAPDPVRIIKLINANCEEPFRRLLKRLLAGGDADCEIKCLVADANWYFTQSVSESVGIRRIVMRTSGVCSFWRLMLFQFYEKRGILQTEVCKPGKVIKFCSCSKVVTECMFSRCGYQHHSFQYKSLEVLS